MLQIADTQWKDHLYSLDHLKEGIGLRGYGQRDPLVEYKKESFELFQAMKERVDEETVRFLWRIRFGEEPPPQPRRVARPRLRSSSAARATSRFLHLPASARRSAAATRTLRLGRQPSANRQPARVGGDDAVGQDRSAGRAEGRPQRSVPMRQREEIQEVSWTGDLAYGCENED